MSTTAEPRHPMVIAGAIREAVERLQNSCAGDPYRLLALCDELEQSLTIQQFSNSLHVISRPEQVKSETARADKAMTASADEASPSSGSTQRCERGRRTRQRGTNAGAWFSGLSFNGGTR